MENEQILHDFFSYFQPLINGCAGFIKTEGYMTYFPGTLIMIDNEEMYCAIIEVPVIHNLYLTANINTFLGLKDVQSQTLEALYFLGNNLKCQRMLEYYNMYHNIDTIRKCIYYEPDCFNINDFQEQVAKATIGTVHILDTANYYRFPASKAITNITKGDTASLSIYDYIYDQENSHLKTSKYSLYKKKFKVTVNIFSNILLA